MEKALIEGELSAEKTLLKNDVRDCERIKDKIIQLEEDYMTQREKVCLHRIL